MYLEVSSPLHSKLLSASKVSTHRYSSRSFSRTNFVFPLFSFRDPEWWLQPLKGIAQCCRIKKTLIQARSASLVATGLAGKAKGRERPLFAEASPCWSKVCQLPSSLTLDFGWMEEHVSQDGVTFWISQARCGLKPSPLESYFGSFSCVFPQMQAHL